MPYNIKFSPQATKQFSKLDKQSKQAIAKYLDKILEAGSLYDFGKPLASNLSGLWRYRVSKYRVICDIHNDELIIEVITLGKRDKVYI